MSALSVSDLAYAAALIDTLAVLKTRDVAGTALPEATINARHTGALRWLGDLSGTRISTISRDFHRGACSDHCPEPHVHVVSTSGRWSVSGAKATIVLHNVMPYMRAQRETAAALVLQGQQIGWKGSVVTRMRGLGWDIPELKPQPRARSVSVER